MKKSIIFLLVTMICIVCCFSTRSQAYELQPNLLMVDYENAPEGTVYVDILVKMDPKDEAYAEFNVAPRRYLGQVEVDGQMESEYEEIKLTKDSEIARYHEDGFMSLSMHSLEVRTFTIFGEDSNNQHIMLKVSVGDLVSKYKKFKIAYIGSNGEILKVTKVSQKVNDKKIYDGYKISVDGDAVKVRVGTGLASSFMNAILTKGIVFFLIPPAIIISFIVFFVEKKVANKKKKSVS